jgi:D-alanyl-D-alanine carboxypeptidase
MHAETSDIRFECAKQLLNHAFANYALVSAVPDEAIPPVEVRLGEVRYMQPVLGDTKKLLLKKSDAAGLTRKLELLPPVQAPVAKGQTLGKLAIYTQSGQLLVEIPVVAPEPVGRLSFGRLFLKYLRLLFTGKA